MKYFYFNFFFFCKIYVMKQKYWIIKYIVDNEETKIASKKKKRGTNSNYWRKIEKKRQSHILRLYFHFLFRRLVIDKVGLYFWLNWFWTCADVRITEYANIGKSWISDSLVLQVLSRKTWVKCAADIFKNFR